jgi:3'(2'), 5'-bisphosphate nucleotidase
MNIEDLISLSEKLPIQNGNQKYTVVGSRSHMSEETTTYIEKIRQLKGEIKMVSRGSALKLCLIAEGKADLYPRFGPTMEWDTAAGHAVINNAGFAVYLENGKDQLTYNKENLVNPYFIAGTIP